MTDLSRKEPGHQDPERIWLEPPPGGSEGRTWCEDKVWPIGVEEEEPTEYIRADIASPSPPPSAGADAVAGIYIASKTTHGARWRDLRASGVPIISTWIDEAEAGATSNWPDLWHRCVREASRAAATIVYREPGEVLKGAFVEMGAALSSGRTVFAVGCEEFSVRHHMRFVSCGSLEEAVELARETVALTPAPAPSLAMPSREWMRDKIAADPDVEDCGSVPVTTPVEAGGEAVGYMRPQDKDGSSFWCRRQPSAYYSEPVYLAKPASSPAMSDIERAVRASTDVKQYFMPALAKPAPAVEALASGCCSASSPCFHQKHDPTTICEACRNARLRIIEAKPAPAVEALGPAEDWSEKLAELYTWTGSAFLAGEKVKDEAGHKSCLYSFLCGLIGYLTAGRDAALAPAAQAGTVAQEGRE